MSTYSKISNDLFQLRQFPSRYNHPNSFPYLSKKNVVVSTFVTFQLEYNDKECSNCEILLVKSLGYTLSTTTS